MASYFDLYFQSPSVEEKHVDVSSIVEIYPKCESCCTSSRRNTVCSTCSLWRYHFLPSHPTLSSHIATFKSTPRVFGSDHADHGNTFCSNGMNKMCTETLCTDLFRKRICASDVSKLKLLIGWWPYQR